MATVRCEQMERRWEGGGELPVLLSLTDSGAQRVIPRNISFLTQHHVGVRSAHFPSWRRTSVSCCLPCCGRPRALGHLERYGLQVQAERLGSPRSWAWTPSCGCPRSARVGFVPPMPESYTNVAKPPPLHSTFIQGLSLTPGSTSW